MDSSEDEHQIEDEDVLCKYGTALTPYEADEIPSKKPIHVEDQIVKDENGRRRFHGAFTGGFSAGYWNTVGSKDGFTPAEFKSSRKEKGSFKTFKPSDFMDDEDMGEFGIAPQKIQPKDDFAAGSNKRKFERPSEGPIPGEPVLQNLLKPVHDKAAVRILKSMGWKDNQGIGSRLTFREKKKTNERNMRELYVQRKYGCDVGPGRSVPEDDDDDDLSDDEITFAPDDFDPYIANVKENRFGLGYSGLQPSSSATKHVNLFQNFEIVDRNNKKLSIRGQAFGVGALEEDDDDIYEQDDLSRYDKSLEDAKSQKKRPLAIKPADSSIVEGFSKATISDSTVKVFSIDVSRNFVPRNWFQRRSRFAPLDAEKAKILEEKNKHKTMGLGRHDMKPEERGRLINEESVEERKRRIERDKSGPSSILEQENEVEMRESRENDSNLRELRENEKEMRESRENYPNLRENEQEMRESRENYSNLRESGENSSNSRENDTLMRQSRHNESLIEDSKEKEKEIRKLKEIDQEKRELRDNDRNIREMREKEREIHDLSEQRRKERELIEKERNSRESEREFRERERKQREEELKAEKEARAKKLADLLNTNKFVTEKNETFKPFAMNPDKQTRYEKFLELKTKNESEIDKFLNNVQPLSMSSFDREMEKKEFIQAKRMYQPLDSLMANRFIKEVDVKKDEIVHKKLENGKEVVVIQRSKVMWKPHKDLCKRFNIPEPFGGLMFDEDEEKKRKKQSSSLFDYIGIPLNTKANFVTPQVIPRKMAIDDRKKNEEEDKKKRFLEAIEKEKSFMGNQGKRAAAKDFFEKDGNLRLGGEIGDPTTSRNSQLETDDSNRRFQSGIGDPTTSKQFSQNTGDSSSKSHKTPETSTNYRQSDTAKFPEPPKTELEIKVAESINKKPEEKKDLFKAIFCDSDDEDEENEDKTEKETVSSTQKVLSEQQKSTFIESFINTKNASEVNILRSDEKPSGIFKSIFEVSTVKTRENRQKSSSPDTYGPKLPENLLNSMPGPSQVKESVNYDTTSSSDSSLDEKLLKKLKKVKKRHEEDEWVEKDKLKKAKKSKKHKKDHKKKHKKNKSRK